MNANVSLTPSRSVPFKRIARAKTLDQLARRCKHPVGVLDERVTFGGEAHARPAPNEQRRIQRGFELADALRHAGLRQLELERRRVEAAEAHDALERPQLAESDVHDRSILS
jgi:hypothetical protein